MLFHLMSGGAGAWSAVRKFNEQIAGRLRGDVKSWQATCKIGQGDPWKIAEMWSTIQRKVSGFDIPVAMHEANAEIFDTDFAIRV
jgi:hypothetical protein